MTTARIAAAPDPSNTVDSVPPPARLFALGLQHVLVMYAGSVAVPMIIGGALKLPKEDIAFLISADLFCCGLVTLIQSVGIFNVGIRLPIMMGIAFTAIAPIISTGTNPALGIGAVFGAVIGSGVFAYLAAPYMSRLVRWFPPVVTGTLILVIGLSLLRVGINWAAGGQPMLFRPGGPVPNPDYGLPLHLAIAGLVLLIVVLVTAFGRGFLANVAVLVGMGAGFVASIALGQVSFAGVEAAPWVSLVLPFHFGLPSFDAMSTLTLSLIMVVMMIESTGLFLAAADITGRPIDSADIARGLRADGLGNVIGGIFGTFCYTSYSQNVGLLQVTNVRSRWVVAMAAGVLVVLGCLPKLSLVVASVPQYVLGGAAIVMFGMVAATGVKILGEVEFTRDRANLYIVSISVVLGLTPLLADRFFSQLPPVLARFMQNGTLLCALSAVVLNLLFHRGRAHERREPAVQRT
ncbi:MAG: purine permease [Burkholderiales bacterium]|nr:purine permease [Burkholderiales bacterium]MDE2394780.1 purine permease [Burkholderiales bacterium]MDE2455284.1 purine permease [Burkholderiales bacterium]